MKIIIAGVTQEVADGYAVRLMEQGKAIPVSSAPKPEKPKGKRSKDVSAREPKDQD